MHVYKCTFKGCATWWYRPSIITFLVVDSLDHLKLDVPEIAKMALSNKLWIYFIFLARARNNARKRKQPPEAKRGDTKRNRTGP